jgi:hypothetical protein
MEEDAMSIEHVGMLHRVRQSWHRTMQRRRTLKELAACSRQELDRIASDVGLSGDQLRQHCRYGHGIPELLLQRLQLLDIDPEFVRQAAPTLFRDLVRVCASCADSRRCARDLANSDVQAGMSTYCPNGASIDMLTVSRGDTLSAAERGG